MSRPTGILEQFDRPLGVAFQGDLVALTARHALPVSTNARRSAPDLLKNQLGRYGALYVPRASYPRGDLCVQGGGRPACAARGVFDIFRRGA
jgi:hypothetical protein